MTFSYHSLIQQIFTECLAHARHLPRCWGLGTELIRQRLQPSGNQPSSASSTGGASRLQGTGFRNRPHHNPHPIIGNRILGMCRPHRVSFSMSIADIWLFIPASQGSHRRKGGYECELSLAGRKEWGERGEGARHLGDVAEEVPPHTPKREVIRAIPGKSNPTIFFIFF